MKKPIVIEGPDGSGKSALRDRLAADLRRTPIHTGGPTRTRNDVLRRNEAMMGFAPEKVIFDRVSPISDTVYRQAEGRKILVKPEEQIQFLKRFGAVIIYCCLGSSAEMVEHIDRTPKAHKPEDYLEKVLAMHPKVVEAYEEVITAAQDSGLPVIRYNWKTDSYPDLLRWLACVA